MEQVTAVGKETTFFLLLVLAASASATSLNTIQQNTAITATSGKQVRSVWGVCKLDYVGTLTKYTPYNHILSRLFLQKKAIPTFPLKACTSSNAGEMWKTEGRAQVDLIWVCQNNKWIPYERVRTNVTN